MPKKKINYIQAFIKAMVWEFKFIFKDKAIFSSFVGVAIIISFLYTYVYSKETLKDLPIAVVDNDNTTHSRQLLRMIDATEQAKIYGYYNDLLQAKKSFDKSETRGVIVIPSNFSKKLQRGEQPTVSVYADASYVLYYKQVVTAVKKSVGFLNAGIQVKKKLAEGNPFYQAKNTALPVQAKTVNLFNVNSGYATFLIPVVLVIIFQTTMLNTIGILGGTIREDNKVKKLYPEFNSLLGTLFIVIGKSMTYLIISLVILLIMVGICLPFYNIPMRSSFFNIAIFMIPFLLSIVYLGIFLTSFFKRREDAILLIMFTSMPALLITGFSWPTQAMPTWVQIVSYFAPSTLGAKGFIGLSQLGASFSDIKTYWLMMWGLCLFYLILAVLSSKRLFLVAKD